MKVKKVLLSVLVMLCLMGQASFAVADSNNSVPYKERVNVKVGQSVVIHGLRGECGKAPKKSAVASMEQKYRDIKVGKIVAGKAGVRRSRSCGGATPVVEAVFVAQKKGRVKIELFGDPISIRVK